MQLHLFIVESHKIYLLCTLTYFIDQALSCKHLGELENVFLFFVCLLLLFTFSESEMYLVEFLTEVITVTMIILQI